MEEFTFEALEEPEEGTEQIVYEKLDRDQVLHTKRGYWFFRRTQDIVFSLLALLVLWPVLLIICVIIFLDDPEGSPIFSQMRCGRDGKVFRMYKFRTMYKGAESMQDELMKDNELDGPAFKIKDDPRVTRIGKFLRRTNIDELPQLINILIGQMSIVGPRPALPREVMQYNEYQMQRLYVQPGLTCYLQITKEKNQMSFDEWIELDMKYIRERSFVTDWKIIGKTLTRLF